MSNDNKTIHLPMILDTGSQITTISNAFKNLITPINSVLTDTISTSATGEQTGRLTKVLLTLTNGKTINAYYSPLFHSNLMSIKTLTQELGKVAIITKEKTHILDNNSPIVSSVLQLIKQSKQNTQLQHSDSLIPITISLQNTSDSSLPVNIPFIPAIQKVFQTNQLGAFSRSHMKFPEDQYRLGNNLNISKTDQDAFRLHDYYHYKFTKLSKLCLSPLSPMVQLYIDTCPVCKNRPPIKRKRDYKDPSDKTNYIPLEQRIVNNTLNPAFTYTAHIDTAKIDPECQSTTVRSVVVIVLKPYNYVKLIPITTSQPTQQEVHDKVTAFFLNEIKIAPQSITSDRGTEFNSLHKWAATHHITSLIAATGDSQFNGVAERFIKEVSLQYGLLTYHLTLNKVPLLNQIIFDEIANRLNSDRRDNPQSPHYYLFGKDVSPRYINKGIPLFSDIQVQTANGQTRTGIHLGYHLKSNRALVYLHYKNNVQFTIQPIHHSNITKMNTFIFVNNLEHTLQLPKELQTNNLTVFDDPSTGTWQVVNDSPDNTVSLTPNVHDYILLPKSKTHNTYTSEVHFVLTNQLNETTSHNTLSSVLNRIEQDKPIPLNMALSLPETREAMKIEVSKWLKAKAIIPHNGSPPTEDQVNGASFWIHTIKKSGDTKFKARLITIIPGTTHTAKQTELYSPVTNKISIQTIIHKALSQNLKLATLDVAGAFLQAVTKHPLLIIKAPPGFNELALEIDPTFITAEYYKVEKALYGLKDSPLQWNTTLLRYFYEDHFNSSLYDKCLLFHESIPEFAAAAHVDDLLYTTPRNTPDDLVHNVLKKRKLETTNNNTNTLTFLGLNYTQGIDFVNISIKDYLTKTSNTMIQNLSPRLWPLPTYFTEHAEIIKALHKQLLTQPYDGSQEIFINTGELNNISQHNKQLIEEEFAANQQNIHKKVTKLTKIFTTYKEKNELHITNLEDYQKYLGIAGYITNIFFTEYAIYHITLSSYNTQYSEMAAHALQHFISFLYHAKETLHQLRPINIGNNILRFTSYSDANWSRFGNSCSGMVITVDNQIVYTKSKQQSSFSTSTYIAELKAIYITIQKSLEIVARYRDTLPIDQHVLIIKCDNMAVISTITTQAPLHSTIIASNLQHQIISMREQYAKEFFEIEYIKSKENPADLFTKPLGPQELKTVLQLPVFANYIKLESSE